MTTNPTTTGHSLRHSHRLQDAAAGAGWERVMTGGDAMVVTTFTRKARAADVVLVATVTTSQMTGEFLGGQVFAVTSSGHNGSAAQWGPDQLDKALRFLGD